MGLKEKILARCDRDNAAMEKSECPQPAKEKIIKMGKVCKEVLEIVCGMQGITPNTAIQILDEAKNIIERIAMTQEI